MKCYKCKCEMKEEPYDKVLKDILEFYLPCCEKCIKQGKIDHYNYKCVICGEQLKDEEWGFEFVDDKLFKAHERCQTK